MEKHHVCPAWAGYILLLPVRKLRHNPYKILSPYVRKGMAVMDYGCAMGYFSIPLAKMTGTEGKVYCVDIQEKMLSKLQRRAAKYNVADTIEPLQVDKNYNPEALAGKLDLVLLFFVVHELPNQQQLFNDLFKMLKSGGKILFAEPNGHVKPDDFERSLQMAQKAGLRIMEEKPVIKGLRAFLIK